MEITKKNGGPPPPPQKSDILGCDPLLISCERWSAIEERLLIQPTRSRGVYAFSRSPIFESPCEDFEKGPLKEEIRWSDQRFSGVCTVTVNLECILHR